MLFSAWYLLLITGRVTPFLAETVQLFLIVCLSSSTNFIATQVLKLQLLAYGKMFFLVILLVILLIDVVGRSNSGRLLCSCYITDISVASCVHCTHLHTEASKERVRIGASR